MTTWINDEHGNRCSVEYFGSEAAARTALESLKSCRACTNCSYCSRCSACSDCSACSACSDCSRITGATDPLVVGPFRQDGYQFVLTKTGTVHAGCRNFKDMAAAREHWNRTRGGTALGDETTAILDFLEAMAARRGGVKTEAA